MILYEYLENKPTHIDNIKSKIKTFVVNGWFYSYIGNEDYFETFLDKNDLNLYVILDDDRKFYTKESIKSNINIMLYIEQTKLDDKFMEMGLLNESIESVKNRISKLKNWML